MHIGIWCLKNVSFITTKKIVFFFQNLNFNLVSEVFLQKLKLNCNFTHSISFLLTNFKLHFQKRSLKSLIIHSPCVFSNFKSHLLRKNAKALSLIICYRVINHVCVKNYYLLNNVLLNVVNFFETLKPKNKLNGIL